jgi:hypothetical protein
MSSLKSSSLKVNYLQYVPHKEQLKFHAGMGVYSQRAALCGTGAGKTLCGLYEDIRWALAYPGSVGYIFEPTYPMIYRIVFTALESPYLLGRSYPFTDNPLVRSFSRSHMCLEWSNGSQWWFVSLDHPENAEGPNLDYGHIDEARLILHFDTAWLTVLRRLRGSGRCKVPIRPSVWITTTTDSPGSKLYNAVENPKTRSPNCRVYRWSIFDNPKLPTDFVSEIVRTHTGGFADRFVYGRFAAVGGGSFAFDSSVNVAEPRLENLREIRYGLDFGWTNPTALVATGIDGDGRVYVLDELYERQLKTEELVKVLKDFYKLYGQGEVLCDPSSPETIDTLRRADINASGYKGKREDGIRELGGRFPKAGDGKPRIFVSEKCVNLVSELLEYKEEVKENDHAIDALRYSLRLYPVDENVRARFIAHPR